MNILQHNSNKTKWELGLNLSDLATCPCLPKVTVNLKVEGSLPGKPSENRSTELAEEISRFKAAQEVEAAERETERKRLKALRSANSRTPAGRVARHKRKRGRGGHEFPRQG